MPTGRSIQGRSIRVRSVIGRVLRPDPPAPSCTYPLDATESELQSAGFAGRLSMDATEQIGTYTVQSGLGSAETYGAGPAGIASGSADLIDFGTGKKAIKAVLERPQEIADFNQAVFGLTTGFTERFSVAIEPANGLVIELDNTDVYTDSGVTSGTHEVILIFDSSTSTVTAIVNGTEVTLSDDSYTPGQWQLVMNAREEASTPAGDAGKTVTDRLVTDAGSMTDASGYSATDPCGNAI